MPPSEWDEQLGAIDGWADISEEEVVVADGTYLLQVQNSELKRAKTGTLMWCLTYAVIDGGEFDGEPIYDKQFPESLPGGARRTKKLIRILGFEPPIDPKEVAKSVDDVHEAKPQVEAKVTSTLDEESGFRNYRVKVLKLLSADEHIEGKDTKKGATRTVGTDDAKITVGATVSFADNDGDSVMGIVKSIKGKVAHIQEGDDPDLWKVNIEKITIVDAEDGEPENGEADGDDLDELDRKGLKALIKEEELEVTVYKGWDEDKIREAIREARPEEEPEESGEAEEPGEAEPEEPAEAEETEEPATDDKGTVTVDDLITVGNAHGLKLTEKMSNDKIVSALKAHTWVKGKLVESEVDILEGIGCTFKKAAARTVVTRTAKKKKAKGKKKKKSKR